MCDCYSRLLFPLLHLPAVPAKGSLDTFLMMAHFWSSFALGLASIWRMEWGAMMGALLLLLVPLCWPLADQELLSAAICHTHTWLSEKGWVGRCGYLGIFLQPLQGVAHRAIPQIPSCHSLVRSSRYAVLFLRWLDIPRDLKRWESVLGTLFHHLVSILVHLLIDQHRLYIQTVIEFIWGWGFLIFSPSFSCY